MTKLIEAAEQDWREILSRYDTPATPAVALIRELNDHFRAAGCTLIGDEQLPVLLKPYLLDGAVLQAVAEAQEVIMRALEKITDLYFTQPETRPLFRLRTAEEQLVEFAPGYTRKNLISRNAVFVNGDSFHFLEFNCDSPGGLYYADTLTRLTLGTPIMKELQRRYEVRAESLMPGLEATLLDAYREFGGTKEKPFITVLAGDEYGTLPEWKALVRWLRERGYEAEFSDPRWLEYAGGVLRDHRGNAIDVIYRRGWLEDWTEYMKEIRPLLRAYADRRVCIVNSLRSTIAAKRHVLGLLQDPALQQVLTPKERQVVAEHVPWTQVVEEGQTTYRGQQIDLLEYIRAHKDQFVLRALDPSAGRETCVGPRVSKERWEEHLEACLRRRSVVQEYVPEPTADMPVAQKDRLAYEQMRLSANLFAYNGAYAGGVAGISHASLPRVYLAGGLAALFTVVGRR